MMVDCISQWVPSHPSGRLFEHDRLSWAFEHSLIVKTPEREELRRPGSVFDLGLDCLA